MAMAQTAFRTRLAFYRHSIAVAKRSRRSETPLFQAFLRPSSVKVTDGHCIKDTTTIDGICSTGNSLTNTNDGRVVKVECGNAKYMEVNA